MHTSNASFKIFHAYRNIKSPPEEVIKCSQTLGNTHFPRGHSLQIQIQKKITFVQHNLYYLCALKQGMNALKLTSVL